MVYFNKRVDNFHFHGKIHPLGHKFKYDVISLFADAALNMLYLFRRQFFFPFYKAFKLMGELAMFQVNIEMQFNQIRHKFCKTVYSYFNYTLDNYIF